MNILDILAKKRDGLELSRDEIAFFVRGATAGSIADYQVTALLMAGRINGFTRAETIALTMEMLHSGEQIDLSEISGIKVDKHSTGGVGDKTSLVVLPIVAAAGLKGAKMSGRGLGHTGGTLDKLAAIPDFRYDLPIDRFKKQVTEIGLSIISQTSDLVPADQLFYGLRDVTATVDSIPLIAASIMSKKLAMGADVLVLDVKYGAGALVHDIAGCRELASLMVEVAKGAGIKASAMLTAMDQPLGLAVGNALEITEVRAVLDGAGPADLREVALAIAAEMLAASGLADSRDDGLALAANLLDQGQAKAKFVEMVRAQGGSDDFSRLPKAGQIIPFQADCSGYLHTFHAEAVGLASMQLGAGRQKKTDQIDPAVGIVLEKKVGSYVQAGDTLAWLHCNNLRGLAAAENLLRQAVSIQPEPAPTGHPLILEIIR